MDTTSFIHDYAFGDAERTSFVVLLSIAQALSNVRLQYIFCRVYCNT